MWDLCYGVKKYILIKSKIALDAPPLGSVSVFSYEPGHRELTLPVDKNIMYVNGTVTVTMREYEVNQKDGGIFQSKQWKFYERQKC